MNLGGKQAFSPEQVPSPLGYLCFKEQNSVKPLQVDVDIQQGINRLTGLVGRAKQKRAA